MTPRLTRRVGFGMSQIVLYSYYRSSCSYRVRIALHHKGLDFEYRAVHLVKDGGEQKKDDYLALNPMGEVPCLIHDGQAIAQSVAIIEYLETLQPEPRLYPGNAMGVARIRQVCEMINAGIQPIQNLRVLKGLDQRYHVGPEGKAEWVRHWITRGFEALESKVRETAGQFCMGDEVTAADVFLAPQVYNANRYQVDMDLFPTLNRINANCLALEAFQKADPSRQPDTPSPP